MFSFQYLGFGLLGLRFRVYGSVRVMVNMRLRIRV